jgi:hypothetical protein
VAGPPGGRGGGRGCAGPRLSAFRLVAASLTEDCGGETPQGGVGWWTPGVLATGAAMVSGVSDEDAAEGVQDRPAAGAALSC